MNKKDNIFKCRIQYSDNGIIKIIPYRNNQIPYSLFHKIKEALLEVKQDYNGESKWKNKYIHFNYNGHQYKQIDHSSNLLCEGCVFHDNTNCKHPYYLNGTKGNCENKIYVEYEK